MELGATTRALSGCAPVQSVVGNAMRRLPVIVPTGDGAGYVSAMIADVSNIGGNRLKHIRDRLASQSE